MISIIFHVISLDKNPKMCTFLVASISDPGGVERVGEEAALVAVHGEALDAADKVCRADLFGAPQVDGLAGAGHSAEVHGVSVEGQCPVIKTLNWYIDAAKFITVLNSQDP